MKRMPSLGSNEPWRVLLQLGRSLALPFSASSSEPIPLIVCPGQGGSWGIPPNCWPRTMIRAPSSVILK